MTCNACRRRLLAVFVPEFKSSSNHQFSRRSVRAFTSSRVQRHQPSQKLNHSIVASTSTSTQDDLTIPFLSTPYIPNDANITKDIPKRLHEPVFEPRLQLEQDAIYDKDYVEAEENLTTIPKLGKHARKKMRRRAADLQTASMPSDNSNSKITSKTATTTGRRRIKTNTQGARLQNVTKQVRPSKLQSVSAIPTSKDVKTPKMPNPMKTREAWQVQKKALEEKFGESDWTPNKKLSPDAMDGIRALHAQYPDKFTTPVLAKHFKVSSEAIRRILKSKWQPNPEEDEARRDRWERRGLRIWSRRAEKGLNPPSKWRSMGAGKGLSRQHIERGEAGKQAKREEYSSDTERRLKQLMAEIPDLR